MKCLNINSSLIYIEQYTLSLSLSLSLSQIKSSPFNCVVRIEEKRIVNFYNLTSLGLKAFYYYKRHTSLKSFDKRITPSNTQFLNFI